jgi:hypothetical protein
MYEDLINDKILDEANMSDEEIEAIRKFLDFILDDMDINKYDTMKRKDIEQLKEIVEQILDGTSDLDDLVMPIP